jgi:ATP-dependent Clp protease ATP-binding subunit ClpB
MAAAPPLSADVLSFLTSAPAAPTPVVAAAWGAARAGPVRGKAALRTTRGGRGGVLAPLVGRRPRQTPLSVRCNATSRDGRV